MKLGVWVETVHCY